MSTAGDFVFSTLIANHPDPATASRALALAEAAVLRRAADAINTLPQDYECDPGRGDAAERLRRTAAGIEEKSSPAGAVATPGLKSVQRRVLLLTVMTAEDGEWTTGRVKQTYRRHGFGHVYHGTYRRDLAALMRDGHLIAHDQPGHRFYTLTTTKGGTA